jgi:hypothetical protein
MDKFKFYLLSFYFLINIENNFNIVIIPIHFILKIYIYLYLYLNSNHFYHKKFLKEIYNF